MAVLVVDSVQVVPCDDCPRSRVVATEATGPDSCRVTVLDGCDGCAGSTLVLRSS